MNTLYVRAMRTSFNLFLDALGLAGRTMRWAHGLAPWWLKGLGDDLADLALGKPDLTDVHRDGRSITGEGR
jgi:hypothetical protein